MERPMISMRFSTAVAALLATAFLSVPAAKAQSSTSLTVPEIQQCLCMQPQLQPLQNAWLQKQQDFDEQQAQLKTIDQEVISQRQKLNPEDIVGQQVLKDLLSQQQGLRDAISTRALPALNQAREAYNAAVMQYNGLCTRPRYSGDEEKARLGLVCVAP
jgi:Spy/CpxP family protein refolding chaperone